MDELDLFSPETGTRQRRGEKENATDFNEVLENVSGDMNAHDVSAMIPPWEYDADMPRDSIWWMMGRSGDHMDAFKAWFQALPEKEQAAFTWKHPEPAAWQGFYDDLMPGENG